MGGFVKVYDSILESSVWGESLAVRVVWITVLAMADRKGLVAASSDGISRRANVPIKATESALSVLESPDSRSKSPEFEGRRIERVDGGYRVLNYSKYRELQTEKQKADAARQKRFRDSHRDAALRNGDVNGDITPTSRKALRHARVAPKAEAEAEAEAEAKAKTPRSKATTSASGEATSWVAEGVEWWLANVGVTTHPRFGAALKVPVVTHGWPAVFAGLKCYVEDARARGKPAKLEWYAAEIVRWVEWAAMPATDEHGILTARGRAIAGAGT
jgi:hypothetical protein